MKRVSEALVKKSPELDDKTVRELPLYSYRILYEIKAAHIEILAVLHKRQNVQAKEIRRDSTDD